MEKKVLLNMLLLMCMMWACNDDAKVDPRGIQLYLNLTEFNPADGNLQKPDLPEGATLRISLETDDGRPIVTNQKLSIQKSSQSYVTERIQLAHGKYRVVYLAIGDKNDEIVFVSPSRNSTRELRGDSSLLYHLNVQDNVASLNMQVTPSPKKTTFAHAFGLSVLISGKSGMKMTDATGYILNAGDTLATLTLKSKVNRITIGELPGTATLVVVKDGFNMHTQKLIADEINSKPLRIMLTPAFTLRVKPNAPVEGMDSPFMLGVQGASGRITVNWGDGTIEDFNLTPDLILIHSYPTDILAQNIMQYFVSISGDLQHITAVVNPDYAIGVKKIVVNALPNLATFNMGFTELQHVDLSMNDQLQRLGISYNDYLTSVILPQSHEIAYAGLNGITSMSGDDISGIISNVYHNTVEKNITNGLIQLWDDFDPEGAMVGPPSQESIEQLRILRDQYQWTVEPDVN